MSLSIRHALGLDDNLLSYLTDMTVSWTRKKLPIQRSTNGLAFWNGVFIGIPDLRNSSYSFVLDHSIEKQFSFYSALTFHESMHAKFLSHFANKQLLSNNPAIPSSLLNFSFFIHNIIEDGRIERLGLIKRVGSVIHNQLYSFNVLTSEFNWKRYHELEFVNSFDEFINHIINQLFDLILLGRQFLTNFLNKDEESIINEMNQILKTSVFPSQDPNASIKATIRFFEILNCYFANNDYESQQMQLPTYQNHCDNNTSPNYFDKKELEQILEREFDLSDLHDFFDNPFSDLFDNFEDSEDDDIKVSDDDIFDKSKVSNKSNKNKDHKRSSSDSNCELTNQHSITKQPKKNSARIIPKLSKSKENLAYSKFVEHSSKGKQFDNLAIDEDETYDYIDTFGNDMNISDVDTEFKYSYNNLEEMFNDYLDEEEFKESYDRLLLIAKKTANFFLKLAGMNLKKKDGFGNQKIVIGSQKSGKLLLTGKSLSQLLAGNRFIYNKEMPARINITLDLVILVDLTGSMEFQVNCDGRTGCRIEFVNEATIILAETLNILQTNFNLPISFTIIGYNAPDSSTPLLDIIKGFETQYLGKSHAKAILGWYPDGENCDARAIYESVKLLEKNVSKSENKVIFFLSDGGGEAKDQKVIDSILEEYPNFNVNGPKDYTDAIRYANVKGIKTYIINLESFNNAINNYDIKLAFNKYYGENVQLVENLNDLISVFENIKTVLEDSGSKWENIVDVTVFLTNMDKDFKFFNKLWAQYFNDTDNLPTRTTVEVNKLPTPIAIELKVIAKV